MKRSSVMLAACLLMAGPVLAGGKTETAPALKVGDPAPAFSLPGTDGKTYSLKDYLGKEAVVLAFFPKAFTSG